MVDYGKAQRLKEKRLNEMREVDPKKRDPLVISSEMEPLQYIETRLVALRNEINRLEGMRSALLVDYALLLKVLKKLKGGGEE